MKVGRTGTCSSDWSCILIPRFFAVNVVRILSHDRLIPEFPPFRPLEDSMDEQPKHAILFAATILAARKLNEIGVRSCPARECAISDAIENAKRILEMIDERWPSRTD